VERTENNSVVCRNQLFLKHKFYVVMPLECLIDIISIRFIAYNNRHIKAPVFSRSASIGIVDMIFPVLYYAGNRVMYRLLIAPANLVRPFAGIIYIDFLIIDIISMITAIFIINHLQFPFICVNPCPRPIRHGRATESLAGASNVFCFFVFFVLFRGLKYLLNNLI